MTPMTSDPNMPENWKAPSEVVVPDLTGKQKLDLPEPAAPTATPEAAQKDLTANDYLRKATNILASYNNEVSNIPQNSEYWSAMNAYRAAKRGDL